MPRKIKNLYQRNGIWWASLKVAGSRYRSSLRTTDPREAKLRLDAWRKKLERKTVGFPEDHTFREAAIQWVETVLPGAVKPSVAKRYRTSLAQLNQTFGRLRMSEIDTRTISDYLAARSGKATNATLNRDLTALSRLLSACVAWGWRSDNPARLYDRTLIRERREPIQPPTEADLEALLRMAPTGMAAVLRLLAATGMRENEAVTLERHEVDWIKGQITLTRTKTSVPRAISWSTPGGDASPVLNAQRNRIGPLFISEQGQPYRNFAANFTQLRNRVVIAEKAAGRPFRPFRVHDLRHAFAVRWLKQGGDIYRLQKHLGHSSIKTTERYLAYLSVEEQEALHEGAQKVPQSSKSGSDTSGTKLP